MTTTPSGVVELKDRGALRISGPEAREFLQGLISNDMKMVAPDQTIYAALLTPQGKFLFDFFISQQNQAFLLETRLEGIPGLLKKLKLYKLRADVTIEDISSDTQVLALLGQAVHALNLSETTKPGAASVISDGLAYIDPRLPAMGARMVIKRASAAKTIRSWGADSLDFDAYTQHRLGLGIPEGGIDIVPEKAFLLESNFDEMGGVDHQKGCYIGQETTSRTKRRGSVRRRILPIVFPGPAAEPGTTITAGEAEVGTVLSGAQDRALASIRLDRWQKAKEAGDLIKANDMTISIEVPDWLELHD